MALKTHKFARKPFYVDAVRVSEDNITEVAKWCQGKVSEDEEGKHIEVKVHRPLTPRQTKAYIGDWVLFAGTGYKVYTPKAFDKSFEKVKTLTKAQADEAGIKPPIEPKKKPQRAPKPQAPKGLNRVADAVPAEVKDLFKAPEMAVKAVKDVPPAEEKDEADKLIDEVLGNK
jgi:hypothetical protein